MRRATAAPRRCIPATVFLSENAEFAEACAAAGHRVHRPAGFGHPDHGIEGRGQGADAARTGVPLVPGYHGDDQDPARLLDEAERIGFPVLIKASAGGGGRGMRVVDSARRVRRGARRRKARGGSCLRRRPRADRKIPRSGRATSKSRSSPTRHGNTVHLFERDCSIQRRHQKVLEEAPAPGLDRGAARAMAKAAVAAARAVGYVGAGTVEFIAEAGDFYFIEMNTRLQVEHPVTEAVTGLDLVEWQLRVAAGEPLPVCQPDLVLRGHAIEARLYAEDPERGFLPQTGTLHGLRFPPAGSRPGRYRRAARRHRDAVLRSDDRQDHRLGRGSRRGCRPAAPCSRRDRGARGRDQPRRFWRGSPRIRNSSPAPSIPALSSAITRP